MTCNQINELSILYLDGKLSLKKRYGFLIHQKKCGQCRAKFNLIKTSYDTGIKETDIPVDFTQPVMESINIHRYSEKYKTKRRRKALTAVFIAAAMCITVTVYAKPLLKTFDELLQATIISSISKGTELHKSLADDEKGKTPITTDDARRLYKNYRSKIQEIASSMKPGEVRSLFFEGESEDFFVNVGKGKEITSIFYGSKITGAGSFDGSISSDEMAGVVRDKDVSINEFIANKYFIPVLKDAPQGYEPDLILTTASDRLIKSIRYKSGDNYLSIILSEDRTIIDDAAKKSMEMINGMQAVYAERDKGGRTQGQLIILLGDNKRQRIVILSSLYDETINKEKLIELAENMVFYNQEMNEPENQIYFKDVKGQGLDKYLKEFYDRIQADEQQISIPVTSEINLYRIPGSGKIHTYYLAYSGSEYKEIEPYCNYPLVMNKSIYERCSLREVNIAGFGYKTDKEIRYSLKLDDMTVEEKSHEALFGQIFVDASPTKYSLQQYSIFDIMVNDRVRTPHPHFDEEKLIFDKNNHPYIVSDAMIDNKKDGKYFRTIFDINGRHVRYNIVVRQSAIGDMDEYEFINGLEFVK